MSERVLITGAAGFLGSFLTERFLELGASVEAVDNLITGSQDNWAHLREDPRLEFRQLDVSEAFDANQPPDLVLHFACPASPKDYLEHPVETMLVDSYGTHNTLEIARRAGARYVLASTSEVYGDPAVHPQPEEYWGNVNPIGQRSPYDEAKRFSEALSMTYARKYGLDVRIARIFNTYGPRMRLNDGRAIPNFVQQALQGTPLTVYGDGLQTRTFCYVADLIEGVTRLSLRSGLEQQVINVGGVEERSVLEMAEMIRDYFSPGLAIEFYPPMGDDPQRRKPDITKARELLEWEPIVRLEEGLRLTAESMARKLKAV